jgi:hypothetical protein
MIRSSALIALRAGACCPHAPQGLREDDMSEPEGCDASQQHHVGPCGLLIFLESEA